MDKPTHVYVARQSCGCVVGLVSDLRDKFTGQSVSEFIADGCTVDRVTWDDYKNKVSVEPGFMDCQHGQLALPM